MATDWWARGLGGRGGGGDRGGGFVVFVGVDEAADAGGEGTAGLAGLPVVLEAPGEAENSGKEDGGAEGDLRPLACCGQWLDGGGSYQAAMECG